MSHTGAPKQWTPPARAGNFCTNGLLDRCRQAHDAEASPDDAGPMPIVDTHQHLWDLSRFRLPWLKGAPRLDRSFLANDYRLAAEGLNVVKSVYMEVDVEPTQQVAEADHVLGLIRNGEKPLVAAVIARRPGSEGFAEFLALS